MVVKAQSPNQTRTRESGSSPCRPERLKGTSSAEGTPVSLLGKIHGAMIPLCKSPIAATQFRSCRTVFLARLAALFHR